MDEPRVTPRQYLTHAAIPALFLLLWSSGFIAAKTGLAHAETLTLRDALRAERHIYA